MNRKMIFWTSLLFCLTKAVSAEITHPQVIISNGSPKLGQMIVTYQILSNNPVEGVKQSSPATIYVDQNTEIALDTSGTSTATLVPTSVNGHLITGNENPLNTIKKADVCAITLDSKHLVGKLHFTEVTKAKGSSYISCSTEGGIVS